MMKLQKSGTTEINIVTLDHMRQLEGALSVTDTVIPFCICKRVITPFVIWWNTTMTSNWNAPMTTLWDTHMDSKV